MPPFDVDDLPFMAGDATELAVVFVTMIISFAVMVVLGYWWQR